MNRTIRLRMKETNPILSGECGTSPRLLRRLLNRINNFYKGLWIKKKERTAKGHKMKIPPHQEARTRNKWERQNHVGQENIMMKNAPTRVGQKEAVQKTR